MTFQERSNNFQLDIEKLQKKYDVALYAAQVVLQNGEIATLIKLRDLLPQETVIEPTKTYENKPKKGNPISKETQADTD
jgi:hypothetical protein